MADAKVELRFPTPTTTSTGATMTEAQVRSVMYVVRYRDIASGNPPQVVFDGEAVVHAFDVTSGAIYLTLPEGVEAEITVSPHFPNREPVGSYPPITITPERLVAGPMPEGDVVARSLFVD